MCACRYIIIHVHGNILMISLSSLLPYLLYNNYYTTVNIILVLHHTGSEELVIPKK